MKWIAALCIAAWITRASGSSSLVQSPPDLLVSEVTVDGKTIPSRNHSFNLGPFPANIVFHVGSPTNAQLPDLRVRYKLDGIDDKWHDGNCYMFLAVRFCNEARNPISEQGFRVSGESAGWNGSLSKSEMIHRREVVTVPPHASRLLVAVSSGGPPATIGVYAVANLTVTRISSNAAPSTLLEFPPQHHGMVNEAGVNSLGWVRDGNVPSMATIVAIGRSRDQKALAVLDNNPTSHGEWHNASDSAPAVTPGDQILLEWDEMFSMGVADLHAAQFLKLPEGHFLLRVAEFDLFGKPTGNENVIPVVVPPPLWGERWFWPACAVLVMTGVLGNWRYIAWRKVRREMSHLKNQQTLEKERLRIAQDIHDDLGARITEISLASALAKKTVALPETASDDFERISGMSRELVAALYETVWVVNPENDNLDSLGTYLCQSTNRLCKQARLPCRLEMDELPRNVQVSSQVRHNIAIAVKEAAQNAVKHSQASEITLHMTFKKPELNIWVNDNGVGFNIDGEAAGNGLNNIKRRLAAIGGRCIIESHPGRGTSIQLHLNL